MDKTHGVLLNHNNNTMFSESLDSEACKFNESNVLVIEENYNVTPISLDDINNFTVPRWDWEKINIIKPMRKFG